MSRTLSNSYNSIANPPPPFGMIGMAQSTSRNMNRIVNSNKCTNVNNCTTNSCHEDNHCHNDMNECNVNNVSKKNVRLSQSVYIILVYVYDVMRTFFVVKKLRNLVCFIHVRCNRNRLIIVIDSSSPHLLAFGIFCTPFHKPHQSNHPRDCLDLP